MITEHCVPFKNILALFLFLFGPSLYGADLEGAFMPFAVFFLPWFARSDGYGMSRQTVATHRAGMVIFGAGCSLLRRLDASDVV
jgi:hypothetical protein